MSFYVYILKCSDNSYYTGSTNNLEKRIHKHSHLKQGAHYTKIRRPVKLIYKKEYKTFSQARKREKEIQSWTREKKERLLGQ